MLFLLLFVTTFAASNKDIEKILTKYSKTQGLDAVQGLKDFKISGVDIGEKDELAFNYYFLKPNFHRFDIKSKKINLKMTWDGGKEGYLVNGTNPPQRLSDNEKLIMKIFSELIYSPIYEYQKNNYKFSLEGIKEQLGKKCFRILKTEKSGVVTDLYIDSSKYELLNSIKVFDQFEEALYSNVVYKDYAKFGDIKVPKSLVLGINDVQFKYRIDSVMYNIGLIPDDFRKPF